MNRNIVTKADVQNDPEGQAAEDGSLQRLLKYVPAETIGAYVASEGLVKSLVGGPGTRRSALLVLFLVLCAFNWVYLLRVAKVTRRAQIAASEVAFVVYVFAVGGFWASFPWWKAGWGSLAVVGFALLALFVKPARLTPAADVPAADVPAVGASSPAEAALIASSAPTQTATAAPAAV